MKTSEDNYVKFLETCCRRRIGAVAARAIWRYAQEKIISMSDGRAKAVYLERFIEGDVWDAEIIDYDADGKRHVSFFGLAEGFYILDTEQDYNRFRATCRDRGMRKESDIQEVWCQILQALEMYAHAEEIEQQAVIDSMVTGKCWSVERVGDLWSFKFHSLLVPYIDVGMVIPILVTIVATLLVLIKVLTGDWLCMSDWHSWRGIVVGLIFTILGVTGLVVSRSASAPQIFLFYRYGFGDLKIFSLMTVISGVFVSGASWLLAMC